MNNIEGESFRPNTNSVSLAGEFAALSQLALRGFDASPTLARTKGVDILASHPTGPMARLEVKTGYHNKPVQTRLFGGRVLEWIMSAKQEEIDDERLFYDFVNIEPDTDAFTHHIVPNDLVAQYIQKQHELWQNRDGGPHPESASTMRKFRLGLDDDVEYPLPTPLVSDHKDRWDLLL